MIVLHIGPHKTATTYIQNNLYEARDQLKAHGWIYPEIGTLMLTGHHDLAHDAPRFVEPDSEMAGAMTDLARSARAEDHNLLFSAEGFCRWTAAKLNALAARLEAETLDLVYVVRDPLDTFYSYWAEEMKQGFSVSFPERLSEHLNSPMASERLNPMVDLNRMIGLDNIRLHAVPFEVLRNRKIDIFEHICEKVLGLPDMKAANDRPENTSFPIELTEFLRVMTLIAGGGIRRMPEGSDLRQRFTNIVLHNERMEIVKLIRRAAPLARRRIAFPANSLYTKALARSLLRKLDGCWTLPFEEEELFHHDKERVYFHYDTYTLMQSPDVMEVVHDVMDRIKIPPYSGKPRAAK